jgi:hypothetical protein
VKRNTVPGSVAFLRVTRRGRRGCRLASPRSGRRHRHRSLRHIRRALRGLSGCRRCFRGPRRRPLAAVGDRFARCATGRIDTKGAESTEHTEYEEGRMRSSRETVKWTPGNPLARAPTGESCFHWTVQCAACVMRTADSVEGARPEGVGRSAHCAQRCALRSTTPPR